MSINNSFGLVLSKISKNTTDIFYFGGEPLMSKNIKWPKSSNGNYMNHAFTISSSIINQYTSLQLPENRVVSVFSDNSYIGDLCESPQVVEEHFSRVILSNIEEAYPAPEGTEVYPVRHVEILKHKLDSYIGGKPNWLQTAFVNKEEKLEGLHNCTFLFQMQGTTITESIGKRVENENSWYYTNNIYEDSCLYVFLKNDMTSNESSGFFFLQMT